MERFRKFSRIHLVVSLVSAALLLFLLPLLRYGIWFWDEVVFLGIAECLRIVTAAGLAYHLFSLIWFFVFSEKTLSASDRFLLETELSDPTNPWWKRARICLTPGHVVYVGKSIHVIPYSFLGWAFIGTGYNWHTGRRAFIRFCTKDGKRYTSRSVNEFTQISQLEEVLDEIHKRRPDIQIGFSFENKQQYEKEILKNGQKGLS